MKRALLVLLTLLTALIIMVSCDNAVDYPFDDDVPAVETPEMVPLTFEFIKDGKVIITNKPDNMKFTRNSGAKQDVPVDGIINAEGGDRIKLFATRTTEDDLNIICDIGDCYIYGNVMSLIKEDGFADKKDVFDYAFFNLFSGNTHIKSHSSKKLLLPATTLAKGCYNSMFEGCTGLTIAPDLPAEQLAQVCYFNMFAECSNLKTAPIISAKELAVDCCSAMFRDCTSLTTAPALPATTLAESCYSGMFEGCTSLTSAPDLKAATLANSCYQSMFKGCTSLTSAPELNASTLVEKCYEYMFYGCSSLNYIKCLATNPGSNYANSWVEGVATDGFFYRADNIEWERGSNGVPTSWFYINDPILIPLTLEFLEDGELTISNPPAGNMWYSKDGGQTREVLNGTITISVKSGEKISLFANRTSAVSNGIRLRSDQKFYAYGNVMSLNKADGFEKETRLFIFNFLQLFMDDHHLTNHPTIDLVLPATKLDPLCYNNMFYGCSDLIKAPVLPATRVEYHCYDGMFYGCTSLTTAPVLPATDFSGYTYYCYDSMFADCTSLTAPPDLPATDISLGCYANMFSGCTHLQTAPNLPATVLKNNCYTGMFRGCTNLTTAPLLPASTLAEACYWNMFYGCTNLNKITCLATDISATSCTEDWLKGVSSSGTFTKALSMNDWETGESGIPSGWTVINQ